MFNSPFAFNGFNSFPGSQAGFSTPWNQSWNQGWNQPWNSGWNPTAAQTPSWNPGWSPSFAQGWNPNTPFNGFNQPWNQQSPEFSGFGGGTGFNGFASGFGGGSGFGGNGFGGNNFGPSNFGSNGFGGNSFNGFSPFWNQSTPAWNWFNSPAAFAGQFPSPFGFNWWNAESAQSEPNTPFNFNPFSGVTPSNTQAA